MLPVGRLWPSYDEEEEEEAEEDEDGIAVVAGSYLAKDQRLRKSPHWTRQEARVSWILYFTDTKFIFYGFECFIQGAF